MQISPRSPSGTYVAGSCTLANLSMMRGRGIPHEPPLRIPRIGVNVPDGDVSVIPQPSFTSAPVTGRNLFCTSTGNGAPPDAQYFSAVRSRSPRPGYDSSAVYIVGTPMKMVIFFA